MTQVAHRCQCCGQVYEYGQRDRWCNACQPTAVIRRRPTLDVESIARNLVRDGLAPPSILGATYQPGHGR